MRKKSSSSVQIFSPRWNKKEAIRKIKENISSLKKKLPLTKVVLFGSYARGNYSVGSDIDLLVVYEGKKRGNAYSIIKKTMSLPGLEPHPYSEEEYHKAEDEIKKMTKGGIILFEKS